MTRTDTEAPEIRHGEFLRDVLQSVVTGIAAALLQLHASGQEIELIMDDKDFLGLNVVVLGESLYGGAGPVHVGRRLHQPDIVMIQFDAGHIGAELLFFRKVSVRTAGEFIGEHKARVVARAIVFRSDIAETDNE